MKRKDVTGLVNACDAGREGELIFRYIVQHARAKKPIERLWLQSMTPAIDPRRLRRPARGQGDAAARRRRQVPLGGRLAGRHQRHARHDRVQLQGRRLLSDDGRAACRRRRSRSWSSARRRSAPSRRATTGKSTPGSAPRRASTRAAGSIPKFKKDDEDAERKAERLWSAAKAEAIVAACRGKTGIASEESKPTTQLSPLLYDLTSLQREANGRFGFPARMTLSLAQALYERHKVLTYPRTDSRALPEDYLGTVKETLEVARRREGVRAFARQITEAGLGEAEQAHLRQQRRSPTTSRSSRRCRRPST